MSDLLPDSLSGGRIESRELDQEMRSSFLDYAMSVIVSRALPDVRDGLKPVHRRVLYGMHEDGLQPGRPYKKSAATVGTVISRYHPHGDSAIYDTLVRMAQPFSLRYPLVDGQGNFGSIDGDPAAAMRYSEARLSRIATELLRDIDAATVDFEPNYDESRRQPSVLPSRFPNLLVNGSAGIAVGMATNIPPHNLGEAIDGIVAMIDDPSIDVERLLRHVKGPDFPTGGYIVGRSGIRDAYRSGRGRIVMRARAHIEELRGGKNAIIVTELPYGVKKGGEGGVIEKIAELVESKVLNEIPMTDDALADHSDKDGMRIYIELKREAVIAWSRGAPDTDTARDGLMEQFDLSEIQAQAILDLRLARLTGLARKEIEDEFNDVQERIAELRAILGDQSRIDGLIKEELLEIRQIYGKNDSRRTEIVAAEDELELADLIAEEDMVIAITRSNYIKRLQVTTYREQKRGGQGVMGMDLKEDDYIEHLFVASTHD